MLGTPFTGTLWVVYTLEGRTNLESMIGSVQTTVETGGIPGVRGQPIIQQVEVDVSHHKTADFNSPVNAGDMLVTVFTTTFTGSCTVPTITDTLGNSWTLETSACNHGAAGDEYQYSSIWYTYTSSGGTDSVTATTSAQHGIIVIYDLSPPPSTVTAALPGTGTSSSGTYTTGTLSFQANAVLISGFAESDGGACCTPSTGFSSFGVGSGWGSEFSNTIVSPTNFPISTANNHATGWAEVGAAFER